MQRDSEAYRDFCEALAARNAKLVFWKRRASDNVVDMRISSRGTRIAIQVPASDEHKAYETAFKELFPNG